MGTKLLNDDLKLIDNVFNDYQDSNKTDEVCPYCDKPMKLVYHGNSYEVRCETDNCFSEYFRGI